MIIITTHLLAATYNFNGHLLEMSKHLYVIDYGVILYSCLKRFAASAKDKIKNIYNVHAAEVVLYLI